MFSHEGTLAPPGEYDWNCASFGLLESTTKTANGLVQPFCTAYGRKCLYFTMGAPIHQNCPFPWGIWTPHVTQDALGQCEPTTQTAPRSVQPCLYRWPQSVPILFCLFPPQNPQNCSLPCWHRPHVIHDSLGPPQSGTQMATWSFQPFLQGSLVWQTWQSNRQTDRPRHSVRGGVIMRNYVGYGKTTQSFHASRNNFATIKSLSVRLKHLILECWPMSNVMAACRI